MAFVNRQRELDVLNSRANSGRAELLVVYGRRRIGKTSLLLHWLDAHPPEERCYWVAHKTSAERLLSSFSEAAAPLLTNGGGAGLTFEDWESAFTQLFGLGTKRRLLLVLDEFPYLIQSCPELPSLLQKLWDHHGKDTQVVLVLCGSHYHMMADQLFSARQPLYGRATGSLLLDEVDRRDLGLFLPRYSIDQLAQCAAVIGGVPKYLELWNDGKPPLRNVEELILSDATLFRHEALFLIQDELPEPRTYLAILETLGSGCMTPGAIAKGAGIDRGHVGKYLHTLVELRFVRRLLSADIQERRNSRTARYEVRDPYLRFYFEFIYRHPQWLEQGRISHMRRVIESRFDAYVGKQVYEEWARRHLMELGDADELSFVPDEVGRAWDPRVEIDVFAVNWKERSVIAGECKWRRAKIGASELASLQDRCLRLKRIQGFKVQYALFSKGGFSKDILNSADAAELLLFEGSQLTRIRPIQPKRSP